MIRTGTARFWDMYWQPEATAQAVGATIVANPVANMKLAVGGVFAYPAARRLGIG